MLYSSLLFRHTCHRSHHGTHDEYRACIIVTVAAANITTITYHRFVDWLIAFSHQGLSKSRNGQLQCEDEIRVRFQLTIDTVWRNPKRVEHKPFCMHASLSLQCTEVESVGSQSKVVKNNVIWKWTVPSHVLHGSKWNGEGDDDCDSNIGMQRYEEPITSTARVKAEEGLIKTLSEKRHS